MPRSCDVVKLCLRAEGEMGEIFLVGVGGEILSLDDRAVHSNVSKSQLMAG